MSAIPGALKRLPYSVISRRNRLSILIYHRVFAKADELQPNEMTAERFRQQMTAVAKHCNVLSLQQANTLRLAGELPPKALCITFDDGYADNAEVALPILSELGVPATFFIASGFSNGGRMWNDTVIESVRRMSPSQNSVLAELLEVPKPLAAEKFGPCDSLQAKQAKLGAILEAFKYLPLEQRLAKSAEFAAAVQVPDNSNIMMTTNQLKQLHEAGMEIGGHTVNHPILAGLSAAETRREIIDNKQWLQKAIAAPITSFAYPNGRPERDYSAASVAAVREAGYSLAVTTAKGVSDRSSDSLQLPRFTPWDKNVDKFLLRLMLNTQQRGYDKVAA